MFSTYERSLRLIDDSPQNPALQSVVYAGLIGGFCQTVAVTPTDLIKCRLQVQDGHASSHYRGPVDCIKHIYARNGLRGLFLGYPITLLREVPSFGFYFGMYEYAKRRMIASDFSPHTAMLTAGGIAGVGSWIIAYPMDGAYACAASCPTDGGSIAVTCCSSCVCFACCSGQVIDSNGCRECSARGENDRLPGKKALSSWGLEDLCERSGDRRGSCVPRECGHVLLL